MDDASVVVGETVEHTCPRCRWRSTGRPDGFYTAMVVEIRPVLFRVRCECGGEFLRDPALMGHTWRKRADRPEAPMHEREIAPLDQAGMHRLKAQDLAARFSPPPIDSPTDRAMRSKDRRETVVRVSAALKTRLACADCGPTMLCETHAAAEKVLRANEAMCAQAEAMTHAIKQQAAVDAAVELAEQIADLAIATHCNACGSDLRSRLETRPYCARCSPLFGNATVLPLEAPEPTLHRVPWAPCGFRDGRAFERLAENLWRAEADGVGISHPLRSEAIRLWREAWVRRERGRIEAEAIGRRMFRSPPTGPLMPVARPSDSVRTFTAKRDAAAGQLVTEAAVEMRPAIAPPPRVPRVGDEIEVRDHDAWKRAHIHEVHRNDGEYRFDVWGAHPTFNCNVVYTLLAAHQGSTWRWPSEAGS